MSLQCKGVRREFACYDFFSFNHLVMLSMGLGGAEQTLGSSLGSPIDGGSSVSIERPIKQLQGVTAS